MPRGKWLLLLAGLLLIVLLDCALNVYLPEAPKPEALLYLMWAV